MPLSTRSIDLSINIDPTALAVLEDAVTFETGATRAQVSDPTTFAYEHHGPEFRRADPSALVRFYEDLSVGRPMPLRMVTHAIRDVDTLMALFLFTHRALVIHPATMVFVSQVDMIHRYGAPGLAHVDVSVGAFVRHLARYFEGPSPDRAMLGRKIETAFGWIHDYLTTGRTPGVAPWPAPPTILQVGTGGFVVGETQGPLLLKGPLLEGWVDLFRMGHLRGVLFGAHGPGGRRAVWAARKSAWVPLDLERAAVVLNESDPAGPWMLLEGDFLRSPPSGSAMDADTIIRVFAAL